jgi:Cysteine-rich secretory protein family
MMDFHCLICRQVKQLLLVASLIVFSIFAASAGATEKPLQSAVGRSNFSKAMLDGHNAERAKLQLAELQWDVQLAADAKAWAEQLAASNSFEHAHDEVQTKKQGENLWMGTADGFRYPEMLDFWLGERMHAKSGRFPDVSKTGNWMDVAHYTQIVWPTTKRVGCALVKNTSDEFLVCRYFPAGNIVGENLRIARSK